MTLQSVTTLGGDTLQESDRLLRLSFEQSPVANVSWDTDFRVVAFNPAAEKLFGYTCADALGQHASFLVQDAERIHLDATLRELRVGSANESNHQNVTKAGRSIPCEWHTALLTAADGTLLGASSVIFDVTERVRRTSALAQAQKMDALRQLAGGVAHDLNNILAVILSYGSLILEALPEGDAQREDVLEVLKAGDRAAALTAQLLAFTRRQPTQGRHVDLNQSLAELRELLGTTLGSQVELCVVPSERPAVVRIDPMQFDQIVLNLAVNARDAMPAGGQLRVALEHRSGDGGWVHLTVADSGAGMDERTCERIFEPFFATRSKGKGTGLGLSTCYGIATDAGGRIYAESAPGRGSIFTVELPLCTEQADSQADGPARVSRSGRGEIVLVAEDDPAVRSVVTRVLASAGYTVYVASDGHEAIKRLDELGPLLAVLVSDVMMPGCSGFDVAEHAKRVAPGAAVLLTSGFVEDAARRNTKEDVRILWKPVRPTDLVWAVGECLELRPTRLGR